MPCAVEKRACSPSAGSGLPVSSGTSGWQTSSISSIARVSPPGSPACRASAASIAGWVTMPQG